MQKLLVIDADGDSGTGYTSFSYPAGELQVRLDLPTIKGYSDILVVSRIAHAQDIMRLMLLSEPLRIEATQNDQLLHLYLPYLPYARADRRFVEGDCHGLKTFLRLVKSMDYDQVLTLDAHNPEAVWHYAPTIKNLSPVQYITKAAVKFGLATSSPDINILYPDEGAKKRLQLPDVIECHGIRSLRLHKIYASKKRDASTGKLSGFKVEPVTLPTLVVDDICDGGGTFVGIAEALNTDVPMALYTTHGIYSKGFKELGHWYNALYCTDSFVPDVRHGVPDFLTQFDAMDAIRNL